LNRNVEKPYYFQYYTGYVGGGGVHHLCWYYWRISKLSHFYHQIYHQMIGLDEQIFYSHNRNDEPSETEHAEM